MKESKDAEMTQLPNAIPYAESTVTNSPYGRIGLAVITYNRPEYLKQTLDSLNEHNWGGAHERLIVVDEPLNSTYEYLFNEHYFDLFRPGEVMEDVGIVYGPNLGVAHAKNKAIQILMGRGCDHIFLMEDDILMKSKITCPLYIDYAKRMGVQHLNFALHGPMNVGKKMFHDWQGKAITCYPDCVGAFSYYTRKAIEIVGLLDQNFKNAWEHVEHTYRIINAGMHPPFWKFADHPMSHTLLEEIPGSIDNSSIRPRSDWSDNIKAGHAYWMQKHGKWLPPRPRM